MIAWHFLAGLLTIVVIDLTLAGDNALVIAVAVRSLPKRQRRAASAFGAAAAVALRVALTIIAASLLQISFLKLAGGLFIFWISIRMLLESGGDVQAEEAAPRRLRQAIWYIVVADITMSTDNVVAIALASGGNDYLIAFGLSLSIPLVIFAANLVASLMDRYPALIYLGSAILGKVAAEMVLTDAWTARLVPTSAWQRYGVEAAAAAVVVAAGWALRWRRRGGRGDGRTKYES
jgi:YjbE family integral membrane protein